MATYLHPASLNELQRFRQANAIHKNTSRATNADWHRQALDLDFQLHLRIDGISILSFYHNRKNNTWQAGPHLTDEHLRNPPSLQSLLPGILDHARSNGFKSLGVILHLADEFATAEIKPELAHPEHLADLKAASYSDPASILADTSVPSDQNSWRVIPYTPAKSGPAGTAISISRQYESFLSAFRIIGEEENFPVITQALSSPLIALQGLGEVLRPTSQHPFVAVLQYPWFTAMAFFNEHANLVLLRSLQHRGLRRPTNFRHALTTTSASLELVDPDLYVMELGQGVDTTLLSDLKLTFPEQRVEEVTLAHHQEIPAWAPELILSAAPTENERSFQSATFDTFREQKWATQDFLTPSLEASDIFPQQGEMKMLRAFKFVRLALSALVLLSILWASFVVIHIISQPEWSFDPAEAATTKQKVVMYSAEKRKADYWDSMLADRSKAWIEMESLARLFPETSGTQLKNYTYSLRTEAKAGQPMVGFVKEWRMNGFAREEALDYLNLLSTRDGMSAHFLEVAKATGNDAYLTDLASRILQVSIRTLENPSYKPSGGGDLANTGEISYPFTFDITITLRYDAADPMAIQAAKAP